MTPPDLTYEQVIRRIEQVRDNPARPESFERVRAAIDALKPDFPDGGQGVILVGGTNGKGSVSKTLEVLLADRCDGAVGLFTSPHLMQTTERIRSFGRDLSQDEFVQAFRLVEPFVERFRLSHFECLTLMMCEVFFGGRVRPRVAWAVIEVGVGGRLDPTRLVPHATSVVTTIALDHVDLLGDSLRAIAREKFAIASPGSLLVHRDSLPAEIELDVKQHCHDQGVRRVIAREFGFRIQSSRTPPEPPIWILKSPWGEAPLSLLGRRAVENVSLALEVYRELGFDPGAALPAVASIQWPCRMERFRLRGRELYLSGDHNLQGVESLVEILSQFSYRAIDLVIGIGGKKDSSAMLEAFARIPHSRLHLTTTPFRGMPLSAYGAWLEKASSADEDPGLVLERILAQNSCREDLVVCSGSLYMTGHLRERIVSGQFGVYHQ